jgi:WD repeat-containing protein 1 (actin-interacting protein 1)
VGPGVDHQQVGCTWAGSEGIASLSLNGDINIFDQRTGDSPSTILPVSSTSVPIHVRIVVRFIMLQGIQTPITSLALSRDNTLFASSSDGKVVAFSSSGEAERAKGDGHSSKIVALSSSGDHIYSTGFDDRVREIDAPARSFTSVFVF